MKKGDSLYQQYIEILKEELRPAMGCTEPIALAYAAAKARQTLGCIPDKIRLFVSGNIIKNVKRVVVPNTGGLHGLAAAVSAGIVAGNADRELEVISGVPAEKHAEIKAYIEREQGFKVSTLYIAQIKDKGGLEKRRNYNPGSGEGKVPICPPEKEEAIMDAFQHFNLI